MIPLNLTIIGCGANEIAPECRNFSLQQLILAHTYGQLALNSLDKLSSANSLRGVAFSAYFPSYQFELEALTALRSLYSAGASITLYSCENLPNSPNCGQLDRAIGQQLLASVPVEISVILAAPIDYPLEHIYRAEINIIRAKLASILALHPYQIIVSAWNATNFNVEVPFSAVEAFVDAFGSGKLTAVFGQAVKAYNYLPQKDYPGEWSAAHAISAVTIFNILSILISLSLSV
jgi:hypothetical protein